MKNYQISIVENHKITDNKIINSNYCLLFFNGDKPSFNCVLMKEFTYERIHYLNLMT